MKMISVSLIFAACLCLFFVPPLIGQAVSIIPVARDYGTVTLGSTPDYVFTITNTGGSILNVSAVSLGGSDASEFTVTDDAGGSFSLAPSASTTVTVQFHPSDNGTLSASLLITSNAPGSPHSASLSGTGRALSADPTSYNFGSIAVGSSDSKQFDIHNHGSQSLTLISIAESGTDGDHFSETITSMTIAASSSEQLTVYFSPTSSGSKSISLTLTTSDANEPPIVIPLSGTGTAPDIAASPASPFSFGSHSVGQSSSQIFTISNTGNADLHVSGIALANNSGSVHFSIIDNAGGSFTVPISSSETITVHFNPISFGVFSTSLTISSDDPDEAMFVIILNGTGTAPDIGISHSEYNYGRIGASETASKIFTVNNTGNADLHVSAVALRGGSDKAQFRLIDNAGGSFTVVPSFSETICIQFNPVTHGVFTASVNIDSDDPDEPVVSIIVAGTGLAPDISVSPSAHDYGGVSAGGTADQLFSISNIGNIDLHVSGIALGDGSAFSIVDNAGGSFILSPASDDTITVRFNPASSGVFTNSLNIHSDDPDEPVVVITLNGSSSAPDIDVQPIAYSFGNVSLGYDSSLCIIIRNSGDAPLTLSSMQISGDDEDHFYLTGGIGGRVVSAADSDSVTVHFTPTSTGEKNASLTIHSDDPDEPVLTIALSGSCSETEVAQDESALPDRFQLLPNYPNPFNDGTIISFTVSKRSSFSITIYDISGRLVRHLWDAVQEPGFYDIHWDACGDDNLSVRSGVYIVAMRAELFRTERKMMLVR